MENRGKVREKYGNKRVNNIEFEKSERGGLFENFENDPTEKNQRE